MSYPMQVSSGQAVGCGRSRRNPQWDVEQLNTPHFKVGLQCIIKSNDLIQNLSGKVSVPNCTVPPVTRWRTCSKYRVNLHALTTIQLLSTNPLITHAPWRWSERCPKDASPKRKGVTCRSLGVFQSDTRVHALGVPNFHTQTGALEKHQCWTPYSFWKIFLILSNF